MQKLISMIMGFILTLGLTSVTYDFYRMLRKETLLKASKGPTRLSGFTQRMLGSPLATHLSKERKKRGMTVKQFAKYLGLPPSTLFTWENGANPRNFNYLKKIALKLELPLSLLVLGE